MHIEIAKCRICESRDLVLAVSLGEQFLTGIFPKSETEAITKGSLDLVWCMQCNLLQMKQTYDLGEMYGENYGYRSGLNASMVKHLQRKIAKLEQFANPSVEDLVIDIGSNDATSLKAYTGKFRRIGIDPTGEKFRKYYTDEITLIPDFFSAAEFSKRFPGEKAKIITSIAMFYDLESPAVFVRDILDCLDDEGIWHFEQSYLPRMLATNSYDTICHEHLEFYSLGVVKDLLEKNGLRIINVETNEVNGGSFAVTACKQNAAFETDWKSIENLLENEEKLGLNTLKPYHDFQRRIDTHREEIIRLLEDLTAAGKKVFGYGASTKGNVLLQYCGITPRLMPLIAEVNEDKFGSITPGTLIPIVSEIEAKRQNPDYFFVLPWHFRDSILHRETDFLAQGGKFIFPLPEIEIV